MLLTTLVLVFPALAQEETETVKDERSGLVIQMPEQWTRESSREQGSVKFAAIYDLNRTKYVMFSVETGPMTGFEEGPWLAKEKEGHAKFLKTTDVPWTTEPLMVGGVRTTRYTIGGKTEKGNDMRIRGCGFVQNDVFFRILEVSYGGVHTEAADAIKAIWDAVKFEEANPFAEDDEEKEEEGSGEEEAAGGETKEAGGEQAPKGEPLVIEDKVGNFKVSAAPGWEMDRAPQEDDGTGLRMILNRKIDSGDIVASMQFFRIRWDDSTVFTNEGAGVFLIKKLHENSQFFETYFEEGSAKVIRPEIDVRVRLGGADKSCAYEIRALKLSEEAKIEEAKKLIARGDTSVTVPEFKPTVVRGRLAMISPYIYVTRTEFARSLADNEQILAEFNQIHDSLEFASTEGKPPPLHSGDGPFGNTVADPANKAERKKSKVHEFKKGAKVAAALKIDYVLPPGFQEAEVVQDEASGGAVGGPDVPLQVVAQDENNGWVWFRVIAVSQKSLASNEKFQEKQKTFETWISNFESLARGTGRLPKKPVGIRVGNLDGDGCEMEGRINDFRASELNMVTIEGGWWIKVEMRTRGRGAETFADGIKTFLKKFRATKK